ncbi:MAG: hypothetical protein ACRC41_13110 [Sarcina sp.]
MNLSYISQNYTTEYIKNLFNQYIAGTEKNDKGQLLSSYPLDNFYEDIDAVYFARNLGEKPIYELIENYYRNLTFQRKSLIISFIGEYNSENKALNEKLYDVFTGSFGLSYPIEGNFLSHFIKSYAGESFDKMTVEQKNIIYKIGSDVLADKINKL